jgi:DNA-binding transcriptional regulator/RsmH inhibitor MraZ
MDTTIERYPFYLASYERGFDAKGRVSIPSEWLTLPGNETDYFLAWFDASEQILRVYPSQFLQLLRRYTETSKESDPEAKRRQRELFSSAKYLKMDPQNRVRLDEALSEQLGFKDRIVLQGEGMSFCINDPQRADQAPRNTEKGDLYGALEEVEALR